MIIATAGHIDHGKTLLVKALTGMDTDRLPEEKIRGISIDLGFAHATLGGATLSFVDVPGHERFIRNMLAGVCAIDAALLVVAADDGVMPQTLEHVHILDLLAIDRGIAVITKSDRVPAERIEAVTHEVAALVAGTRFAAFSILPVSSVSGAGLQPLRESLAGLAAQIRRGMVQGQNFRLAIDRAFTVVGSGTVVTGTVFNGAVAVGDRLVVSPRGTPVRVRAIQVHGRPAERAEAAQRCALNLAGADLEAVARGDWLLHESVHAPTQRFDARVTVLAAEAQPLDHWTPVHVHLGTVDVPGRIAIPGGGEIAPGESALAQVVLQRPIGALRGDRFVIRDQSARRTLGGGMVLDPFSPPRRRACVSRSAELALLEKGDPEEALRGLTDVSASGVDFRRFARTFNLTPERAAQVQGAAEIIVLGKDHPVTVSRAAHERLRAKLLEALREFHAAQPKAPGIEVAALHRRVAPALSGEAFQGVVRALAEAQALVLSNDIARLAGHDATSNPVDQALWIKVRREFDRAGALTPTVAELAAKLEVKEGALRDFLHRKSRGGDVQSVAPDRFYLRQTLAALAATAHELARAAPGGQFTAAQYRDAIGATRALAIPILELLDKLGITQRVGDNRRAGKDFVPLLGPASPIRKGFAPGGAAGLQIRLGPHGGPS